MVKENRENENLDHDGLVLERRPAELCQIKDYAVLMEMAGSYLCEETVLRKLADGIESNLESVKDYVFRVRRQFVGKPLHEIDITGAYDSIQDLAKGLKRPDEATKERFKQGKVGAALMDATRQMSAAIEELIERVQGKTDKYRKRDLLIQTYDRLKYLAHSAISTYKVLTRIVLAVAVACLIGFVVLFATMETEKDILVHVAGVKAEIQKKEDALAKLVDQIAQARQDAQSIENKEDELTREDKIRLIEIKLKEHNLNKKKEKIQFELDAQRRLLEQDIRRLEELRNKSFIKRLLRLS